MSPVVPVFPSGTIALIAFFLGRFRAPLLVKLHDAEQFERDAGERHHVLRGARSGDLGGVVSRRHLRFPCFNGDRQISSGEQALVYSLSSRPGIGLVYRADVELSHPIGE